MIFIWGSKAEEQKIAQGTFFCPNCLRHTPFTQRRISRQFTFFFIPLFSTEKLAEFVRCKRCLAKWDPVVLALTEEQIRAMKEPWTCERCGNRNSPEESHCLSCDARRRRPKGPGATVDSRPRRDPDETYDY
jgi:hypothetical protein